MLRTGTETNWKLTGSRPTADQQGRRAIGFSFDERGGNIFGRITAKNISRPLCILLDGIALSAPNIQSRITTSGIITGNFTQTQIQDMVNKLNAGSLPARLVEQPISVKTIGPSIGADNRNKGILSGFIGLIGVIFCMAVYYLVRRRYRRCGAAYKPAVYAGDYGNAQGHLHTARYRRYHPYHRHER